MKKFFQFAVVAAFAGALVACGGNAQTETAAEEVVIVEETPVVVEEEALPADSTALAEVTETAVAAEEEA